MKSILLAAGLFYAAAALAAGSRENQIDAMQRQLDFFDCYLKRRL